MEVVYDSPYQYFVFKCAIKYYESSPRQGIVLQPVLPSLKASLFLALSISRLP